ncbi:MAG: hypothetical protein JO120_02970 [Solirubrobacterales bacterium]|nr:hypothetical protein [Solirubrobacterales bacterium]
MKVIGAGLPRTATLSQKVALEMLGFAPCYHMVDVLGDLSLVALWARALEGSPDWGEIFGDCQATVDWPGGFFYRELMEVYPDAKVLLSVRDPESWERSMRETVWGVKHGTSLIAHLSEARARVDPGWHDYLDLVEGLLWSGKGTLAGPHHDRDFLIEAFNRHTEAVRSHVPADRLLIWEPSDGWEPLCEFLEVDVPDTPLPRLNDSKMFSERIVAAALEVLQAWWAEQQQQQEVATA